MKACANFYIFLPFCHNNIQQITICIAVVIDSWAKGQPMLNQLLKPMLIQTLILSGGDMDGHITIVMATA